MLLLEVRKLSSINHWTVTLEHVSQRWHRILNKIYKNWSHRLVVNQTRRSELLCFIQQQILDISSTKFNNFLIKYLRRTNQRVSLDKIKTVHNKHWINRPTNIRISTNISTKWLHSTSVGKKNEFYSLSLSLSLSHFLSLSHSTNLQTTGKVIIIKKKTEKEK